MVSIIGRMSDQNSTISEKQDASDNDESLDTSTNSLSCLTILDGKFFTVKEYPSEPSNVVTAQCQICLPKIEEIKGSATSSSNYLSHLKRKHGESLIKEYETYKKSKRLKLSEINGDKINENKRLRSIDRQTQLDSNITDFVIDSMVPVRVVENVCFLKLVNDLQDSRKKPLKVMSRFTLKNRIAEKFKKNITSLKKILSEEANYVCTTADIWSGRRRSFLGVTCHWISPKTLKRKSAALACRRFKGTHSYDKIATMLDMVNAEYDLSNSKVIATTTDNGSNFVKAFKVYGSEGDCTEDEDSTTSEDEIEESESESSGDVDYNSKNDRENEEKFELSLPNHLRCASHTLNLCVTNDLMKTIRNCHVLSSIHEKVLKKCKDLWDHASRPKSAEIIEITLGHTLSRPGQTRWNALYDSFRQIHSIKAKCSELSKALGVLNYLKDNDFLYIEEYITCTKPIAQTLDVLQGENDVYYGQLLPALISMQRKLVSVQSMKFKYCEPIVKSLLQNVNLRFGEILELHTHKSKNAAIAAFSHPQFKKRWLKCVKKDEHDHLLGEFKNAVAAHQSNQSKTDFKPQDCEKNKFYDFGSSEDEGLETGVENVIDGSIEILKYFSDKRTNIRMLHEYPNIRQVFIKYNTPLPSSAPVERLFSYATMTNMPKSNKICDSLFEMKVILKSNYLNKL